ncbi:outer membrane lipid asymmetry maintenance protein MlaD [Nitrosococcus oceani]|uniref:ABC-type transport system involved in resistance to organic solvents periplasmic component n=2 Tax=Nitrosococcus oceani TaxID=1229 RepID=Q3J7G5_NITOC|nr:outer membrane lipid asymmetry maintenance protein MlaD [Nitrosococcus oceani]ABA59231.1 ABC-type transport system involved in resistance to organic solvents periplasmic component [Nitrosococcus oceani ATCC 19707]KFI18259.1 ABC transporter substrate-binding protein [Nitrosococcus oceani C-27]KFI21437.1 ABC transporter substrate-binding protein [Nitrosococcus oceani]GEM21056.1 outer membrane lipid asymmetry maintenance protein MlaD [Nitrosococcus oceani]
MRQSRTVELVVGLFVAAGLVAFFMLAMRVSNLSLVAQENTYSVVAEFQNIGGLKVRSPVTLAGVTIGRVVSIQIDPQTYGAQVRMHIEAQYDYLPEDTSASIYTSGLLGEQYIALEPGGAEAYLKEGGEITLTQSALVLEELIGQFLYSKAAGES